VTIFTGLHWEAILTHRNSIPCMIVWHDTKFTFFIFTWKIAIDVDAEKIYVCDPYLNYSVISCWDSLFSPNLERAVRPRSAPLVETDSTSCATGLAARWPTCRLPARPRAPCGPYGRVRACSGEGAGRPTGRGRIACQRRNRSRVEIGRHTKYNTKPSPPPLFLSTHHAYIQTYPPLPPSGLCNGPTYVALALWLNGPPCKWSGVEWTVTMPIWGIANTLC